MEEQLFQTSISPFGALKFWLIRLIALSALIFSVYDFNENTFFFSMLFLVSLATFLVAGPWRITLYKEYIVFEKTVEVIGRPFPVL